MLLLVWTLKKDLSSINVSMENNPYFFLRGRFFWPPVGDMVFSTGDYASLVKLPSQIQIGQKFIIKSIPPPPPPPPSAMYSGTSG